MDWRPISWAAHEAAGGMRGLDKYNCATVLGGAFVATGGMRARSAWRLSRGRGG